MFEITFDSFKPPVRFPIERLDFSPEKDGVEQRCPSNNHEANVTTGFEVYSRLVVNLHGKQGRIRRLFKGHSYLPWQSSHTLCQWASRYLTFQIRTGIFCFAKNCFTSPTV